MTISLFGLTLFSDNKGCEALAYSFLDMLSEIAVQEDKKICVYLNLFWAKNKAFPIIETKWKNIEVSMNRVGLKNKEERKLILNNIKKSDLIFDFTEGDSFSDIYGLKRFILQSITKSLVIFSGKKLVLGPQTYGPFNSSISRCFARWIIKHAYKVFSRDELSAETISSLVQKDVTISTDIAMALNAKIDKPINSKKWKIGINISGLLYNGGYNKNNQFDLTVDYKIYINKLIGKLSVDASNQIYLIPHVITIDSYDNVENDLKVCELIQKQFPECIVIKGINNPAYIKGIISKMNIFTGARMHSTIAAISQGVPVIPFSYSKKFKGLFGSLEYPYEIDGKSLQTEEAVNKTLEYIKNVSELQNAANIASQIAKKKLMIFKDFLYNELKEGK